MKLVRASYQILDEIDSQKILKSIEIAGRTCYKSEDKITKDSAIKFVEMVLNRGHESVIEHEKITFKFICDRGVSHECVRHRICSVSQESTRYCDYNKTEDITFIIPIWCDRIYSGKYRLGDNLVNMDGEYIYDNLLAQSSWAQAMLDSEAYYKSLRKLGWKPEQARSVLPNSLKTEVVMTMNLRELRHFFKLRTSKAAHPQMREITIPMLREFKSLIPVIFDDIIID